MIAYRDFRLYELAEPLGKYRGVGLTRLLIA